MDSESWLAMVQTGKSWMKLMKLVIFEQNESLIMVHLVCDGQRWFITIDDVLSGSNKQQQHQPQAYLGCSAMGVHKSTRYTTVFHGKVQAIGDS